MKGYLILFILIVWTIIWKGIALWKAARLSHKWWFITILILNTAGILDILYIYVFSEYGKLKNKLSSNPNNKDLSQNDQGKEN